MSDDRFVSPKPVFKPPTDPLAIEVLTHRPRDHSPSPNVVKRLEGEGLAKLAEMVARIQADAKKKHSRK